MTDKDVEIPDLVPAPDEPPSAYLINEKSGESQRIEPAVSQWMIGDDLITHGGAPSFNWKEPLDARGVERLIFRLATRSAPERLEIKQLASIDSDGSYTKQSWAQPLAMLQWHHPRLYPERPANESPLRYNSKSDTPGWEIDVPLSTESATVYLNVSVNWYGWLFGQLRSGAPYMAGFRVSAITSDRRFSPRTPLRQHPVPWRNPTKNDVIHTSNTFPDMKTPPATPPEVYLTSSEALHEGQHASSDWTVDGEKISVRNKQYPLVWPVPLNVSSSDTVIVRFVTESVPGRIEVRQFGRVDSDGKLAGTVLSITDWNHPKFSSSQFSNDKRLRYNSEVSPPGWELELKVAGTGGISYMNVWAQWYKQGGESYSANWWVSAISTQ